VRVLVTGAHGLLGAEFVRVVQGEGWDAVPLGREDLDVTDSGAVDARILEESPDWIVHCAAYTAVDRAEEDPELAMRVNRDGAANVAGAAARAGARTVYISSDYVFDGEQRIPYGTGDAVGPLSVYGKTKLAGEVAVAHAASEVASGAVTRLPLIVRTGWLYGASGNNFVTAILARAEAGGALRVVDDQRGRPTWAANVASVVVNLMTSGVDGIWHVADGDDATWLEFAREVVRIRGLDVPVQGVSTDDWGAEAPRPRYSVLDLTSTESAVRHPMMGWREALRVYLDTPTTGC
jgi:dTDP-4-dehydrorhamnose reductase